MGDAEPCYISRFSPKLLTNYLESLIAQLPQPETLARRPAPYTIRRSIRELRDEELAGLIADYQAGANLTDLATKYGYNRVGISAALKRAGVQLRRQGLTTRQVDEAERLYAAGQSLARISECLEVDAGTVRTRLIQRDVTMRPTSLPR